MGCPSIGRVRLLVSTTLVVLFALTSTFDAALINICTVSANPSGFDHRQLILEGIVAGLTKSTSRSGHKQMTFRVEKSRRLRRRHRLCSGTRALKQR
jgi:hypothetical protein